MWLDERQLSDISSETLMLLNQRYGVGLFVDGTPMDLGRNVRLLREVSEKSGVKIVASSGFYHYGSPELSGNSPSEIAKWIVKECEEGIEGTDIKPGILKCATGGAEISRDNLKRLSVMGIVQSETGLALYVHCEHSADVAHRQIDILVENGADPERIIIGHTSLRPDFDYLSGVLDRGVYICMDQCHCRRDNITAIAHTLARLCDGGYADRIILSNDYCIHNDFCKREENGMSYAPSYHADAYGFVFEHLYSAYLDVGGDGCVWDAMISKNPLSALNV
jgi:phosphotriesterase-related protein